MQFQLSGKYWWLSVAAIVVLTLIFYHGLGFQPATIKPAPITQMPIAKPQSRIAQSSIPSQPVLDLFNPSNENITRDQTISRTRSELEQLFVIRNLLARCAIITQEQADSIKVAAFAYASRTHLFSNSAAIIAELEEQAQQTHDLVYAQTSCDEPSLETLKTQTLAWQTQFNSQPLLQ